MNRRVPQTIDMTTCLAPIRGEPNGGGKDHFLQDAELFASWGVDYLKLDDCNVYSPDGGVSNEAYNGVNPGAQRFVLDRPG